MPPEQQGRTGDLEALDHVAQWVRFADVKAAVLFAAFGVVLTMLASNTPVIVTAAEHCTGAAIAVSVWSALIVGLAGWTLTCLVRALAPQSTVTGTGLNRFAWPTLAGSAAPDVQAQSRQTDLGLEAWRQTVDLSKIAKQKYDAVGHAVFGLSALIAAVSALVVASNVVVTL